MEELTRLSDIEAAADGGGLPVWAAQGPGGDRLGPGVRAWCHGSAVAVASPNPRQDRLAVAGGGSADAAVLVRRVLGEVGPSYRLLGDAALIDALVREVPQLEPVHTFFWMETTRPSDFRAPGADSAAAGARWLDAREETGAASLVDRFFSDSYARPGRAGVRRWAGVVGEVDGCAMEGSATHGSGVDGGGGPGLLAVAADAWSAAGCGFMGGAVTHPAARGRGLARVVCGFVVDALVDRYGRAALMVLIGNAPAVAAYESLGMTGRLCGAAQIPAPGGEGATAPR